MKGKSKQSKKRRSQKKTKIDKGVDKGKENSCIEKVKTHRMFI